MKPSFIYNLIFSIILAVVLYLVFPSDLLAANETFALGIIIGALIIPPLSNMIASPSNNEQGDIMGNGSTTLYVGNLPYRANEQDVKQHFSSYGKVISVRLMKDRRTGKRKGYGFVELASKDANKVIKALNDSEFQERTLKVRLAKDKVTED